MNEILIDMVKVGMISLVSSKIAKAIGEKDISEIIAGSGWCVIGVDTVRLLVPICAGLKNFGSKMYEFFDRCDNITENLGKLPGLFGEFIRRGMIN